MPLLHENDARGGGPHRAQALPAGQDSWAASTSAAGRKPFRWASACSPSRKTRCSPRIAIWRCSSFAACIRATSSRSTWGAWAGSPAGRDGNMHMGDLRLNIVAIISAMAASVPVAAGAALAFKYKGTRNAAFCFFGDGATSRGDWHEGVNLAAVQKLPVVLICNNNQYAYSTPLEKQMAVRQRGRPRPGLRHAGRDRRRQRRVRGLRGRPARRRARARRPRPVPDRVQDLPHDRPLRARRRRLRPQAPLGRVGRQGSDPAA